jgi:uncharacterized membrane protein YwaF
MQFLSLGSLHGISFTTIMTPDIENDVIKNLNVVPYSPKHCFGI